MKVPLSRFDWYLRDFEQLRQESCAAMVACAHFTHSFDQPQREGEDAAFFFSQTNEEHLPVFNLVLHRKAREPANQTGWRMQRGPQE